MTLRAAAEQALDTLEHVQAHIGRYDPPVVTTIARAMQPTIDALRAALAAEQPQPEAHPVAWMVYTQDGQSVYVTDNPADIKPGQRALPLYTSPQPINKGE